MTQHPHRIDIPEPGYYQMRLAKGAPMVGVHIAEFCHCSINGGEDNACHVWDENTCDRSPYLGAMVNNEWRCVYDTWIRSGHQPITQAEYEYLIADRAWASEHAPSLPEAKPSRAVGIRDIPTSALMP